MNFALFLEMHARSAPDALALTDPRLRLSWAEFDTAANRFANAMRDAGLVPGDRVGLYMMNRVEVAVALMGAMKAGLVPCPFNRRLQGPDLERVVAHAAPRCIITETSSAEALSALAPMKSAEPAYRWGFAKAWDERYAKRDGLSWSANPWAWVVEFKEVPDE